MIGKSEGWYLSVKPGEGWCLHYGGWDTPDAIHLEGFESSFDAFAFLFAHLSIDISVFGDHKPVGRWWTFKPPVDKEVVTVKKVSEVERRRKLKEKKSDKPEQLDLFGG
jgi:hypothetical protein